MKLPEGHGQLALVALFGDKQQQYPELRALLEDLQCSIEKILGRENFRRYGESRVHATIVGLEGYRDGDKIWNRNYHDLFGMRRPMNLGGVLDFLLDDNPVLPFSVKIGGFRENRTYPFTSRDRSPYLRSFSIQGDTVVIMGWPIANNAYTSDIDRLRRSFNRFNVLHKYHDTPGARDNDLYLVLGNVPRGLSNRRVDACRHRMRERLAHATVPPIQITRETIGVVAYPEGDAHLERAVHTSLEGARSRIDELQSFYTALDH